MPERQSAGTGVRWLVQTRILNAKATGGAALQQGDCSCVAHVKVLSTALRCSSRDSRGGHGGGRCGNDVTGLEDPGKVSHQAGADLLCLQIVQGALILPDFDDHARIIVEPVRIS